MTTSKICSRCKTEKPLTEYASKASATSGKHSHCNVCNRAKCKEYYAANKERLKRQKRNRYKKMKGLKMPRIDEWGNLIKAVVDTVPRTPNRLKTYNLMFAEQQNVPFLYDFGTSAVFTQIMNTGLTQVAIRVNDYDNSLFILGPGETQIFNAPDLRIESIDLYNLSDVMNPNNVAFVQAKVNIMATYYVGVDLAFLKEGLLSINEVRQHLGMKPL